MSSAQEKQLALGRRLIADDEERRARHGQDTRDHNDRPHNGSRDSDQRSSDADSDEPSSGDDMDDSPAPALVFPLLSAHEVAAKRLARETDSGMLPAATTGLSTAATASATSRRRITPGTTEDVEVLHVIGRGGHLPCRWLV